MRVEHVRHLRRSTAAAALRHGDRMDDDLDRGVGEPTCKRGTVETGGEGVEQLRMSRAIVSGTAQLDAGTAASCIALATNSVSSAIRPRARVSPPACSEGAGPPPRPTSLPGEKKKAHSTLPREGRASREDVTLRAPDSTRRGRAGRVFLGTRAGKAS